MNLTNTRRTLLEVVAALGAGSLVGVGAAQDESDETDADIELGGEETGWQGVSPDEIEGETNPTLELTADEEYVLEWENLDGIGHNFVIEDEDGEDLVETEIVSSGTQTVEFTASEEMAEYYCQPHPTSMRGDVEIGEGEDGGDETADEEPEEFAAPVDEIYDLRLDGAGWHLEEPGTENDDATETDSEDGTDDEAGDEEAETDEAGDEEAETDEVEDEETETDGEAETDPTLELEEGSVYVLRVENELEPEDVADDEDGDDQGEDGDDDDDTLEGDVQRQPAELVVLGDDDEEVVRSDVAESSGSAAVVFVATADLAAYRDDETGAEGEIDVREGDDGDDEDDNDGAGDEDDNDGAGDEDGDDSANEGDGEDA